MITIKEIKENNNLELIFNEISFLSLEYPDFYNWYHQKIILGLSNGSRKIFLAKSSFEYNKVSGILILKKTKDENKICTFYIDKQYRCFGLGKNLMDIAMNEFNGDKPLITVSDSKLQYIKPFLLKYDFREHTHFHNYYKPGHIEYTFNGILE